MSTLDDKELLELFACEGERSRAFGLIVERYSRRIYWCVRKLVVSHHDADDIVQDVFLKLWSALPTFRGESGLYTWIYRIAVNQSLSFLRAKKIVFDIQSSVRDFEYTSYNEGFFDPERAEELLQRAINSLPPKQRAVFVLRYYDEMPYAEMAQVMGTSEGALKASYHHAAEKVEAQIKLSSM